MSDIQKSMCGLLFVFEKYAGKDGDKKYLSKSELKDLLHNELGDITSKAPDQKAVDLIFADLDRNKDDKVDFKEFGTLVLALTQMCHEHFHA